MPQIKKINSENSEFQLIEVLKRNREKRNKLREFFIEGVKSINYAIENNWDIKSFIYSNEKPLSEWASSLLKTSKADMHIELPINLMDKLSDKDEDYSEIVAVARMPENDLSRINIKKDMLVVVFDRPSSHGNLGTLIRSCEALRVDGLIITGHAVDLYDPKTIRASMGTFFTIPAVRLESHNELMPWIKDIRSQFSDFKVIGSTSKSEVLVEEADLNHPMLLLIGNETYGLSNNYKMICDELVKIPMYGKITSFNVACASSIMLYEIDKQRRLAAHKS